MSIGKFYPFYILSVLFCLAWNKPADLQHNSNGWFLYCWGKWGIKLSLFFYRMKLFYHGIKQNWLWSPKSTILSKFKKVHLDFFRIVIFYCTIVMTNLQSFYYMNDLVTALPRKLKYCLETFWETPLLSNVYFMTWNSSFL